MLTVGELRWWEYGCWLWYSFTFSICLKCFISWEKPASKRRQMTFVKLPEPQISQCRAPAPRLWCEASSGLLISFQQTLMKPPPCTGVEDEENPHPADIPWMAVLSWVVSTPPPGYFATFLHPATIPKIFTQLVPSPYVISTPNSTFQERPSLSKKQQQPPKKKPLYYHSILCYFLHSSIIIWIYLICGLCMICTHTASDCEHHESRNSVWFSIVTPEQ